MRRNIFYLVFALFLGGTVHAQNIIQHAPPGYDTLRAGIQHGKIDTITYHSVTVGTNRRAIIYTPPGFSKKEKISGFIPVAWYWRR